MNELDELSSFRTGVVSGGEPDLARARESLHAEIRAARERGPRSRTRDTALPSRASRTRRRAFPRFLPGTGHALSPWLAGGVAAAVAAVVTAGLLTGPGRTPAGHHPGNVTGSSAATDLTVAYVLDHAAATATRQPPPRPGQYISLSSIDTWMGQGGAGGQVTHSWLMTSHRQVWLPVSGRAKGVLRIGYSGEERLPWGGTPPRQSGFPRSLWMPVSASDCPYPYLAALPTGTAQVRDWVYAQTGNVKLPADDQAWKEISALLLGRPLPPKLAAALFHVAATVPGATVVRHATDAAGRKGIAVSRLSQGISEELIFDPASYNFLGERDVLAVPVPGEGPAGTVIASTAVLSVTVTNHLPAYPPFRAVGGHKLGNSSGTSC